MKALSLFRRERSRPGRAQR